jgi:hypothetical protein
MFLLSLPLFGCAQFRCENAFLQERLVHNSTLESFYFSSSIAYHCHSQGFGGAIYLVSSASNFTILQSAFLFCSSESTGGAVFAETLSGEIGRSCFAKCLAMTADTVYAGSRSMGPLSVIQ